MTVLAVLVSAVVALRGAWSPCGLSVLSSLNPVSERARGHRFGVTATWYVAGAVAGGALLGGGCALGAAGVGQLDPAAAWTWAAVLAAAAVTVASDSRGVGFSLPDHPRQVDERWLVTYRRWIYAGGYGLQIGTGFATYIMTAALYLMVVLAVLTGSAGTALWVGVEFGAVRGLTLLVVARARTPERLRAIVARVDSLDTVSLRATAATSAAVGAVAAGVLGGPVAAAVVAAVLGALVLAPRAARAVVTPAGTSSGSR
jgi:MFS family permease